MNITEAAKSLTGVVIEKSEIENLQIYQNLKFHFFDMLIITHTVGVIIELISKGINHQSSLE